VALGDAVLIVRRGLTVAKALKECQLGNSPFSVSRKLLIELALWAWLAALDDFRNWLIHEAA
jgi:hypothetical protein